MQKHRSHLPLIAIVMAVIAVICLVITISHFHKTKENYILGYDEPSMGNFSVLLIDADSSTLQGRLLELMLCNGKNGNWRNAELEKLKTGDEVTIDLTQCAPQIRTIAEGDTISVSFWNASYTNGRLQAINVTKAGSDGSVDEILEFQTEEEFYDYFRKYVTGSDSNIRIFHLEPLFEGYTLSHIDVNLGNVYVYYEDSASSGNDGRYSVNWAWKINGDAKEGLDYFVRENHSIVLSCETVDGLFYTGGTEDNRSYYWVFDGTTFSASIPSTYYDTFEKLMEDPSVFIEKISYWKWKEGKTP